MFSSAPATPINAPMEVPANSFKMADTETQLEIIFALLTVKEDNEDFNFAKQLLQKLNQKTTESVKFIVMTSGENAGEHRQIYKDSKGQPFYWEGKKRPSRKYLQDYVDDNGLKHTPNASNRALLQYAFLMSNANPVQLFQGD